MADRDLHTDIDPAETQEWRDALTSVLEREGETRAHYLLEELIDLARRSGVYIPYRPTTAYLNTIRAVHEERSPGDAAIEWRIRSLVRWNALAMVVNANRESSDQSRQSVLVGHIDVLCQHRQQTMGDRDCCQIGEESEQQCRRQDAITTYVTEPAFEVHPWPGTL